MSATYILFNPYAGNGKCQEGAHELQAQYEDSVLINMNRISNYSVFFDGLEEDDKIIICGGDGTLNRFVNETKDIDFKNNVYYYALGTGNDFAHDLGLNSKDTPDYCINKYIKNLPTVTINGQTHVFMNGVGYGIDGYCCQVGDALREENEKTKKDKPINYTSIAIKGLLFHFKPRNAKVTVDGKEYSFKKVWIAPTMNGRCYGGGMMPTPDQDRNNNETLSLMLVHNACAFRVLTIFPSIFKGEHVKFKKYITILTGKDITVTFDKPTPIQIDGETILDVTSYNAKAYGFCQAPCEAQETTAQ